MNWIVAKMKWIMLVSGALTCTMIYGAFNRPSRPLVLIVAGLSKLIFIGLVLVYGSQYLGQRAGITIVVDLVMVLLFIAYLAAVGRDKTAA